MEYQTAFLFCPVCVDVYKRQAMERVGSEDTDPDAERKGLGTPATRAAVIEKLVKGGFAERKGKQLIPTQNGAALISVLPDMLTSPQLTAEWEMCIRDRYKLVAPSLPTSRTPDSLNIHEMKPEQSNDVSGLSPPQT